MDRSWFALYVTVGSRSFLVFKVSDKSVSRSLVQFFSLRLIADFFKSVGSDTYMSRDLIPSVEADLASNTGLTWGLAREQELSSYTYLA